MITLFIYYLVFYNMDVAQHDFWIGGKNLLFQGEQTRPSSHPSETMARGTLHRQTC